MLGLNLSAYFEDLQGCIYEDKFDHVVSELKEISFSSTIIKSGAND